MANITDYLSQMQKLTKTNLEILKALNDSFFTKKNHLYAEIDDTTYVIPSFISLENKLNMLQDNFENLVKSPENGEAYFNFDGNTRAIEVRKYSHIPDSVSLLPVTEYDVENNDIFKDFLTPVPYINLEVPDIPNDITDLNVKKIVPKNNVLKELFKQKLSYTETYTNSAGESVTETKYNVSNAFAYADVNKLLLNYIEGTDYVEYDTVYKMPIRKNIGSSTYVIESILSDIVDEDLNEIITIKLRNNLTNKLFNNKLTYRLFDDTIEKPLQIGDTLINYDGTGKVEITEVRTSTNTIVVKVVNGEYLNFIGTDSYDSNNDSDIHDMSKLRFFSAYDFEADKFIKVPLEEDQYVFISIAPINSRLNIQSSWGIGLIVDAHSLKNPKSNLLFKTYYDKYVKNIGDVLFEMTSMITSPVTELSQDDFNAITNLKPELSKNTIAVSQINKHLNNANNIENIRSAYDQKKNAEAELSDVQAKITDLQNQLTSLSFDDTSGLRTVYTNRISELNSTKNKLVTSITKAIDTISLNANSAEIPIENAKYRIRGFYVPHNLIKVNNENLEDHVIGLQIQYRYKNIGSETGTAMSINGINNDTYIYSDWNLVNNFNKKKTAKCIDGIYEYAYEASNESLNEPSYNQLDIPISQGETVDIRVKLIYDFGQPYINITSDWSNIINIEFPKEFTKDTPILKIIEENNNDIETNRFNNILNNEGVTIHINDKIIDQDITYYHKPDNISSGFYTNERRIIPLKDKLQDLSNDISMLKNEILGSSGVLTVSASIGDDIYSLKPDQDNNIVLESYNALLNPELNNYSEGSYTIENGVINTIINISIKNSSDNAVKLYSILPGSRSVSINKGQNPNKNNYCIDGGGVWFKYKSSDSVETKLQTHNQFITFRINDLWTKIPYYSSVAGITTNKMQSSTSLSTIKESDKLGMVICPFLSEEFAMCLNSDAVKSYIMINPGEELIVPMSCSYVVKESAQSIQKVISFDLRTGLYTDPVNYSFIVTAKNESSTEDKLTKFNRRRIFNRLYNAIKYNTLVK